jgi:hypothetical protein
MLLATLCANPQLRRHRRACLLTSAWVDALKESFRGGIGFMKRPVITAVLLFAVAGLAGCPVYDHENSGCYRNSDCAQSYVCDTQSGDCVAPGVYNCTKPADCDATYTCTSAGVCVPGDCTFNGCLSGYRCDSSSDAWGCVLNGSAGAAGESGVAGESGASGAAGQSSVAAAGQGGQTTANAGASGAGG